MSSSASLRPSTPPPSSNLHTPTTPKHGWEDNYQPYSPRKSARVSLQRARAARTPPHHLHTNLHSPTSSKRVASTTTPRSSALSPPSSRMEPTKKMSPVNNGSTVSGALTYDSAVSAAAALDLPAPIHGSKMDSRQSTSTVHNNGMLPTPAKTPTQRTTAVAPGIKAIARNLFPIRGETAEEAMPSPKKARKKYSDFSMGGSENDNGDAPIAIYTDSNDRVPEVDLSADNPFYGESGAAISEPTKRSSKRRKIAIPGEGDQTIEEAERREDGLIYVFRGKKIFRKFKDEKEAEDDNDLDAQIDNALAADIPSRLRVPFTRSSIKPRLLFPTPEQIKAKEMRSQATEDEEEAMTDVDESKKLSMSTPKDQMSDNVATPTAPKFAPASPPVTTRATRSQRMAMHHTPDGVGRDGSESPFRNQSSADPETPLTRGKKRAGESLNKRGRGKKVRGE